MFGFRINMKIDNIDSNNFRGSIVRSYKRVKNSRNISATGTIMNFTFASQHALNHEAGWTMVFGGLTCIMLKVAKDTQDILNILRPEYKAIVARAKQIYSKK